MTTTAPDPFPTGGLRSLSSREAMQHGAALACTLPKKLCKGDRADLTPSPEVISNLNNYVSAAAILPSDEVAVLVTIKGPRDPEYLYCHGDFGMSARYFLTLVFKPIADRGWKRGNWLRSDRAWGPTLLGADRLGGG